MNEKNFEFDEQLKKPFVKEAEQRCLQHLRDEKETVIDVTNNPKYYEDGVDLILKKRGRNINIDVKADTYIHKTMNVFYELIECFYENRTNSYKTKPGWGLNKKLDYIHYVDVENWVLHVIQMNKLHAYVYDKKEANCRLIPHQNYKTIGFLIPLIELKDIITTITLKPLRIVKAKEISIEEINETMKKAAEAKKYKTHPPTKEELLEINEMTKRVFDVDLTGQI